MLNSTETIVMSLAFQRQRLKFGTNIVVNFMMMMTMTMTTTAATTATTTTTACLRVQYTTPWSLAFLRYDLEESVFVGTHIIRQTINDTEKVIELGNRILIV